MKTILLAATALSMTGAAAALGQDTPDAGLQHRDIKALSADDVAAYLAGDGMGFAMAAELNSHPGPRHVLELADDLALTEDQRARTEAVFDRMRARAVELGRRIVGLERELDSLFAARAITPETLEGRTAHIAASQGALRNVHLSAHLEMTAILTDAQVARYDMLRGYGGAHHGHPQ